MRHLLFLSLILGLAACGTERGIPSHGGGKRFSEEQRIVAGAIRQAIAGMDLKELRGKMVRIQLTALPNSGAGNMSWGGIQNVGFNGGWFQALDTLTRRFLANPNPGGGWQNEYQDGEDDLHRNLGFNLSYKPISNFYIQKENTQSDVNYLQASLEMKGHHEGFTLVGEKPEVVLYLLVDTLGTNTSRLDRWLWYTEELKAVCELSYYGRDTTTGQLLFPCRRSGAEGTYEELSIAYLPLASDVSTDIEPLKLACLPVCSGLGVKSPLNGNGLHAVAEIKPDLAALLVEEEKQNYLGSLTQQARSLIDSGKTQEAGQAIQQIRQVDPDYAALPSLQKELAEEQH